MSLIGMVALIITGIAVIFVTITAIIIFGAFIKTKNEIKDGMQTIKKFSKVYSNQSRTAQKNYNQNTDNENDSMERYLKTYREEMKQQEKERKQANVQKGKDYEIFVGNHYENQGYAVKYLGIERKIQDMGIDLIATKDDEVIFMQCKNWSRKSSYKITHTDVKAFMGSVSNFIEKYQECKEFNSRLMLYVISNPILDKSAVMFCKENYERIQYKLLPFKL
jgi:HJR/Mrr/RecB family endonuclease